MSEDLPSDVTAVLTQLFEAGATAVERGDLETARQTLTTAETVCRNKLPADERQARLLHGCAQVTDLLDTTGDTAVATEYLRAMRRRVP